MHASHSPGLVQMHKAPFQLLRAPTQQSLAPTYASRINLAERCFVEITNRRIRRGTFRSVKELEAAPGVGHHVALSVVGTKRLLESGYFRAKIAQENSIKSSSIPSSIVRATQFFEFVKKIADLSTQSNKVHLPPVLFQPMAADDVASALGRISTGSPVNATVEIGGPEQFGLDELVRRDLAARKDPREVISDLHARYYGIQVSERTLVPNDDARLGETRVEDWLKQSTKQATKAAGASASPISKSGRK